MIPDRWRTTTADQIRTGDTFITHFAYATRRAAITVDIVHRERFTNPEGQTLDVIRFTGVDQHGRPVDRGYGSRPDDRVYVVQEAPFKWDVPGCGVFGALAADEPDEEPFDIDTWELL